MTGEVVTISEYLDRKAEYERRRTERLKRRLLRERQDALRTGQLHDNNSENNQGKNSS